VGRFYWWLCGGQSAPPRDRDRSDNRRVPSHDEPSKKRRRANTTATTTNKTKAQLLAENNELRAAQTASQMPVPSQMAVASQLPVGSYSELPAPAPASHAYVAIPRSNCQAFILWPTTSSNRGV
jgi:hypothetical protein